MSATSGPSSALCWSAHLIAASLRIDPSPDMKHDSGCPIGSAAQVLLLFIFVVAVKIGPRCVAQAGLTLAIILLLCPSAVISDTPHMPGGACLSIRGSWVGWKWQPLKNPLPSYQPSPWGNGCVTLGRFFFSAWASTIRLRYMLHQEGASLASRAVGGICHHHPSISPFLPLLTPDVAQRSILPGLGLTDPLFNASKGGFTLLPIQARQSTIFSVPAPRWLADLNPCAI